MNAQLRSAFSRLGDIRVFEQNSSASRRDLLISLAVGGVAGTAAWFYYTHFAPSVWGDFDQIWLGARALLAGRDPYAEVPKAFPGPLFYPLPALLIALPFAPWPLLASRILFAGLVGAISTWAILRTRAHAWPLILSAPFIYGLVRGQWAPLLVASALLPSLGGLMAAKPSIGLAVFAWRPSIAAVVGVVVLGGVSFALQPSWLSTWLATARSAPHLIIPVLQPGGIILLAAIGRWRRADARLLAVLACVPQTPSPYDLFPMALIPRTLRQALIMGVSWNVLYLVTLATHPSVPLTVADVVRQTRLTYWPVYFVLGYFPALMAILSPSPLSDRPRGFATWTIARQRAYRIAWGAVLGVVGSVALLWAYLVWAGA